MHNAVSDSSDLQLLVIQQPTAGGPHRGRDIGHTFERECLIDQSRVVLIPGPQPRPAADPIYLSPDELLEPFGPFEGEDLKFHTRRTGVDDKNAFHVDHTSGMEVIRRRASA